MRTITSSGVILKHPNKHAFAMVFQTFWGFPKIKIQENESLEHAAIRAIHRELGISGELGKYFGSYERRGPISGDYKTIHLFAADTQDEQLSPRSAVIEKAERIAFEDIKDYFALTEDYNFRISIKHHYHEYAPLS